MLKCPETNEVRERVYLRAQGLPLFPKNFIFDVAISQIQLLHSPAFFDPFSHSLSLLSTLSSDCCLQYCYLRLGAGAFCSHSLALSSATLPLSAPYTTLIRYSFSFNACIVLLRTFIMSSSDWLRSCMTSCSTTPPLLFCVLVQMPFLPFPSKVQVQITPDLAPLFVYSAISHLLLCAAISSRRRLCFRLRLALCS
jgi:hypothetical protein